MAIIVSSPRLTYLQYGKDISNRIKKNFIFKDAQKAYSEWLISELTPYAEKFKKRTLTHDTFFMRKNNEEFIERTQEYARRKNKKLRIQTVNSKYDLQGRLTQRTLQDGRLIEVDYSSSLPITRVHSNTPQGEVLRITQKGSPSRIIRTSGRFVTDKLNYSHLNNSDIKTVLSTYSLPQETSLLENKGIIPNSAKTLHSNIIKLKDGQIIERIFNNDVPIIRYEKTANHPDEWFMGIKEVNKFLKNYSDEIKNTLFRNVKKSHIKKSK